MNCLPQRKLSLCGRSRLAYHVQAQFYGLLNEFLNSTAGTDSRNNIVFADNGTILTSQLGFAHTASYNQVR